MSLADDTARHDAILLVSFGGPESPEQVLPFMEQVTAGRGIPRERLEEVSQHYRAFGGRSPINDQNRELRAALEAELTAQGVDLHVYWGNRNSAPFLADELRRMRDDGVTRALCIVTSASSSYSGCRQYREDLARAREEVGDGAPELDKVRVFYNHPGFVEPQIDLVRAAIAELPDDQRADARVVFTTHSIPTTMSRHSDYEVQHHEVCRLVMAAIPGHAWELVYNSRSGPPQVPWLTPDVNDHLEALAEEDVRAVVVVPIGFVSDHMEVVYDLDVEARATAARLGMSYVRAGTVGVDRRFVAGLVELVRERRGAAPRRALGTRGPNWDACPVDCCRVPGQPEVATVASAPPPPARR
ncbi:MAG: ferrochelatase [Nitriliruptor sp.]|uniref:ferrochelatase n=1 Tax=Nitriliruptor sp. TaxID=2448056 RepID=UPI00349FD3CB